MKIQKIQNYNTQKTSFNGVSPKFKPAPIAVKDRFQQISKTITKSTNSSIRTLSRSVNNGWQSFKNMWNRNVELMAVLMFLVPLPPLAIGGFIWLDKALEKTSLKNTLEYLVTSYHSEGGKAITQNEELQFKDAMDFYKETYKSQKEHFLYLSKYDIASDLVVKGCYPNSEEGLKLTDREKKLIKSTFASEIQEYKDNKKLEKQNNRTLRYL